MLQHNKSNEKSQPNTFVDGVKVKISEQYKPPRKIVLPVSCQNCSPGEVLFHEYDSRLEKNILGKLAEWKSARREQIERRKERLKTDEKVCQEIEHFSNISTETTQSEGIEQTHQQLNHKLTDLVLTPVCAKQNFPTHNPVSSKFNLSDFESDNSSPFDNMELKTINDMEVLASILTTNNMKQSLHNNNNIFDKDLGKSCVVLNNKNNEWGYLPLNGYDNISYSDLEYNHSVIPSQHKNLNQFDFYSVSENYQISNYGLNDFSHQFGAAVSQDHAGGVINKEEPNFLEKNRPSSVNKMPSNEKNSKSVPDIMLELEKELKESKQRKEEIEKKNKLVYLKQTILSSGIVDTSEFPESSRKIQDCKTLSKLPDPFPSLNVSSQKLVHYISEMGFPLPRVARACEMFDDNEKKIIEFLLQVQSIEEKNYPGDLVEKALVINNFNLMDSLKYLEAMVVLLDLGFDEEKAEEALIAADSDRDKALDMLIL